MLLILVGVLVVFVVLGALTSGVKSMTKGVDSLTALANRANAKLDAKLKEQRERKP